MTKRELIKLWKSLYNDTEIVLPYAYTKINGKIKKIVILTE